jgi:protoporphyrinogen IX oxidase
MLVYLWLKAIHIAAAMTWISGIVVAGLAVASGPARTDIAAAQDMRKLDAIRRWDRRVTLPAMLMVWALGLTMAMQAGWFSAPWLMIKLAIVAALAALHGVLSGRLHRLDRDGAPLPAALIYAAPATILGVALIAILAVTKPF